MTKTTNKTEKYWDAGYTKMLEGLGKPRDLTGINILDISLDEVRHEVKRVLKDVKENETHFSSLGVDGIKARAKFKVGHRDSKARAKLTRAIRTLVENDVDVERTGRLGRRYTYITQEERHERADRKMARQRAQQTAEVLINYAERKHGQVWKMDHNGNIVVNAEDLQRVLSAVMSEASGRPDLLAGDA